jgi:hypothetical protein
MTDMTREEAETATASINTQFNELIDMAAEIDGGNGPVTEGMRTLLWESARYDVPKYAHNPQARRAALAARLDEWKHTAEEYIHDHTDYTK